MSQELKVPFNCLTITDGRGYWSREYGSIVRIVGLSYRSHGERNYGELIAYFDFKDWNCSRSGLIYTDPLWLKTFEQNLSELAGLTKEELDNLEYSEAGMQGGDFVSMDARWSKETWEKILNASKRNTLSTKD